MAGMMRIVRKTSISLKSTWIKFDGNGLHSSLDMDKYDLMRRVHIDARDFRILDPLLSYPSTILGREKAIVLNLEYIKAIITANEVLLLDSTDQNVVSVVEELKRRLTITETNQGVGQDNTEPFEFRALEVVLEAICSFLDARTTELEMDAYPALDELTTQISSRNLERVRKLKNTMTGLVARVQKVKDELEQLMDDDDGMADLYLSRKSSGTLCWSATAPTIESKLSSASNRASVALYLGDENDVEELEMLLELRGYIDDTEDYINIHIDNHRNRLIQLELFLSSADLSLSFLALVCGLFGMSIPYTWNQDHDYMFKWVVIFAAAFSVLIFLVVVTYARKRGLLGS
ncbi:magnesium transporter MRS2-I-like [Cajanus cajan]|uniref:magnesium transporter MRS2-I-like n=1 Tax=Cajanus cajan TaxID=3821 RepID=UPI00098D7616|nr:magnesium transporter MRS2-I-like [Cajanus cajan]